MKSHLVNKRDHGFEKKQEGVYGSGWRENREMQLN